FCKTLISILLFINQFISNLKTSLKKVGVRVTTGITKKVRQWSLMTKIYLIKQRMVGNTDFQFAADKTRKKLPQHNVVTLAINTILSLRNEKNSSRVRL